MKKLLFTVMLLSGLVALAPRTEAQVRVGVNINIGDQPPWRPAGYDYVDYYYLPDIECYYYVPRHQFIYLSNGRWVFSASLPYYYRNYDLYGGYKVVVNRPNAYYYFEQDRVRYAKWKQPKYYKPEHHDNGWHKGWYKQKRGRH